MNVVEATAKGFPPAKLAETSGAMTLVVPRVMFTFPLGGTPNPVPSTTSTRRLPPTGTLDSIDGIRILGFPFAMVNAKGPAVEA